MRDLKLAVWSDGRYSEQSIRESIARASYYLKEQVGITLSVSHFNPINFSGSTRSEMLSTVYHQVIFGPGYDSDSFDLAIGYAGLTASDYAAQALASLLPVPLWLGVIDDEARKVVVLKSVDETVLMHEVLHSFILEQVHGNNGLMAGYRINLVPFLPPVNRSHYISLSEREEVLKNKWREIKFSSLVSTGLPDCEKDYLRERPKNCEN